MTDIGNQKITHVLKPVFSSESCPFNISLDVENKPSIISPTHDSKIITRLQHCSDALQAVSSVADNKSNRSKIG